MKVRRYRYILNEVVEEEHNPQTGRPGILPVPLHPLPSRSSQKNLALLPATSPQPQRGPMRLALKSVPLAILSITSILMIMALACALVGLFILSLSEQPAQLSRRPANYSRHLPTFTPTSPAISGLVAPSTTAAPQAALPSETPAANSVSQPTSTHTSVPSALTGSQNGNLPTLTSRTDLNVRSGPGLDFGVIGALVAGQSAGITGQNPDGSWWRIEYPSGSGQHAWVSADPQYSTVSQAMPQIVAQAAPLTSAEAAPTTSSQPTSTLPATTPVLTAPVTAAAEATTLDETPALADAPTSTATPLPEGWVFTDMRLGPAPNGNDLLILGILTNNTGTAQILDTIDGLFYDSQGNSIDNTLYMLDFPISEVPHGGRVPFQIQLKDRPNATDFDLKVQAEAGGDSPRQDFEFLEVNATPQGDEYCVAGRVRNLGSELGNYLLVAAVLYDSDNKVINYYYDYFDEALPVQAGEQVEDVAICVDPLQREVAHFELEAWGQ